MFRFYMCFQVRRVCGPILTVLALVWLLAGMDAHVLFELGRVTETFPALHTNVRKVLAVDRQKVAIQQALFSCLIFTEFTLVHFVGSFLLMHHFVSKQSPSMREMLPTLIAFDGLLCLAGQLVALQVVV